MNMKYFCPQNGLVIDISRAALIGSGGEGRIFEPTNAPHLAAKILDRPTRSQLRKLEIMLANPCSRGSRTSTPPPLAWPVGVLFANSPRGEFAGYLMPKLRHCRSLVDVYNPKTRRQKGPFFDYRYLMRAAQNLSSILAVAHAHGYVIGDLNESNFLVTNTARVSAVDTDSWQIRDPASGRLFRSLVGKPDFTPPELQGKVFSGVDRNELHDRFGLGVLVFKLLQEGNHPFDGVYTLSGEPPTIQERIASGYFPFGNRAVPLTAKPSAPPFRMLNATLRELFIRCFETGYSDPRKRPSAQTWFTALSEAEAKLIVCAKNGRHWYGGHLGECPWCERTALLGGRDPFPSRIAQSKRSTLLTTLPAPSRPQSLQLVAANGLPGNGRSSSAVALANQSNSAAGFSILGVVGCVLGILALAALFAPESSDEDP